MNALSTIEQLIRNPNTNIETVDFLLALILSVITAVIISAFYRIFYENRATGSQIHRSFLLISPAITALFIAIQFSLPLSLGLVGALTIIRFRTPIKEPEEVGFIMLVIAAAIVCATFNYLLLVILLGLALLVLLGQKYFPRWFRSKRNDGMVLITLNGNMPAQDRDRLLGILNTKLVNGRLQSISYSNDQTTIHYSFAGVTSEHLDNLQTSISEISPVQKMNFFFNRQGVLN
jgi:hypothetical protein